MGSGMISSNQPVSAPLRAVPDSSPAGAAQITIDEPLTLKVLSICNPIDSLGNVNLQLS